MGEGPLLAASLSGRGGGPRAPAAGWPWDGHTVPPGRQQGGPSPRARPGAQARRRGRGSPLPWQSRWPQVGKKGLERRTRCSVTAGPGGSGRAGRVAENAGQPHGPREVGGHAFHEPGRRGRVVFPRRALLGACEHSVGAQVVGPRLSSARKTVERRGGGSDGGGWSQRQPTARGPGSSPAVKWRTVGEGRQGVNWTTEAAVRGRTLGTTAMGNGPAQQGVTVEGSGGGWCDGPGQVTDRPARRRDFYVSI